MCVSMDTVSCERPFTRLSALACKGLYKSMVLSELWVWFIGVVSGFCLLHRCKSAWLCQNSESVVRSMEVARFSEVAFTLSLCKLQSVPQGLSTVERQSASQRVRYAWEAPL